MEGLRAKAASFLGLGVGEGRRLEFLNVNLGEGPCRLRTHALGKGCPRGRGMGVLQRQAKPPTGSGCR